MINLTVFAVTPSCDVSICFQVLSAQLLGPLQSLTDFTPTLTLTNQTKCTRVSLIQNKLVLVGKKTPNSH